MEFTQFGEIPRGAYQIIVCDPPWRFETYSEKGKLKKSAELHYKTMTIDYIRDMPVQDLAAPDCALFLWTTAPMLPEAMDILEGWEFQYKSFGVWGKLTRNGKIAFGTGYRLRNSHEPYLLAVRGNPKNTRGERSLLLEPVREHSRKPEGFYKMVERWLPDARRLDIFGREARPGWDVFGDQIGKFDGNQNRLGIQDGEGSGRQDESRSG